MVRVGGVAGRPADMAKSSEWRTDFGRFWLRRGIGFAGLGGRKVCAMPGPETGESASWAKAFRVPGSCRPEINRKIVAGVANFLVLLSNG